MNLREEISNALKVAMKENNTEAKSVIRSILAAIKNAEIDNRAVLSDQEIISVLHKEIKVRNETIEGAQKNNRQDLIDEAQNDIKIISHFLPEELSDAEIRELTQKTITEINAHGIADMGKVMKEILPKLGGRASNSRISQIVKELLQS
jgi:uncharacterized protein YqeY